MLRWICAGHSCLPLRTCAHPAAYPGTGKLTPAAFSLPTSLQRSARPSGEAQPTQAGPERFSCWPAQSRAGAPVFCPPQQCVPASVPSVPSFPLLASPNSLWLPFMTRSAFPCASHGRPELLLRSQGVPLSAPMRARVPPPNAPLVHQPRCTPMPHVAGYELSALLL